MPGARSYQRSYSGKSGRACASIAALRERKISVSCSGSEYEPTLMSAATVKPRRTSVWEP